jgi:hypothetical protein
VACSLTWFQFLLGASIVLGSTFIYNLEVSRVQQEPPRIKIYSDEKLAFDPVADLHDVSIQIPKTPLSQEETALATSRPGSPNRKKRKNDNGGYFAKHDD